MISVFLIGKAHAQLITDSDRRLKMSKAKQQPQRGRQGPSESPFSGLSGKKASSPRYSPAGGESFASRKVKSRSASGQPFATFRRSDGPRYSPGSPFGGGRGYAASPRYSAGSPFSARGGYRPVTTRYSAGSPFENKRLSIQPKYSAGSPFQSRRYAASPRYSASTPFGKIKTVEPRYSAGSPFSSGRYAAAPRYSVGSPYENRRHPIQPKYSVGSPFTSNRYAASPRYSVGSPFENKRHPIEPKYSAGSPYKNQYRATNPRYSAPNPFRDSQYAVNIRYSKGSPFNPKDYVAAPRYSAGTSFKSYRFDPTEWYSTGKHRFDVDTRQKKENAIYNFETSRFRGTAHTDLRFVASTKDLFRSGEVSNYATKSAKRKDPDELKSTSEPLMNYSNEAIGNKGPGKDVSKKISKPKFDRKESKIWNE